MPRSALSEALDVVGDRWTLLVIDALLDGPRRFGELEEQIEGIASNVLAARLKRLEEQGLAVAEPYSERPPRYVYELTDAGRALTGPLRLLAEWGARQGGGEEPARHAECGSPLEATWWCPTCERPVADDEAEDLSYA
jgi:DNA-binding HxlR family transcriptional regulator